MGELIACMSMHTHCADKLLEDLKCPFTLPLHSYNSLSGPPSVLSAQSSQRTEDAWLHAGVQTLFKVKLREQWESQLFLPEEGACITRASSPLLWTHRSGLIFFFFSLFYSQVDKPRHEWEGNKVFHKMNVDALFYPHSGSVNVFLFLTHPECTFLSVWCSCIFRDVRRYCLKTHTNENCVCGVLNIFL